MIDGSESPSPVSAGPDLQAPRRRKRSQAAPSSSMGIDRLPPHSIDAERGALGSILLAPNETLGICIEKLKGKSEVFYDLRHQTLYETLAGMYDAKDPIDPITVSQKLRDKNQLDVLGGLPYLAELMDASPSSANLVYYLEIIREKHLLRRILQTCSSTMGRVHEYEGEVNELLDEVERTFLQINESRAETASKTIKDLVHSAINTIEDYHSRQGKLSGVATGFPDLDRMTNGLHPGEMVVIAARPSMGKTSLAMNIAEHAALEQGLGVGVFSLEMTAESLVMRMLCSRAKVNLRSIREGFLAERDFPRLTGAAGRLAGAPLFIDDTAGLSIMELRAKARRMHQQHGIHLIVIDYLQLLNSTSSRVENRQQEIAQISNGIKALAKELSVPVIVLSQLNRDLEKDKSRKPRLSDLRESGAIEQDADLVALLYKADAKETEDEEGSVPERDVVPVNLLIAKQRNGPTGDVPLTFLRSYTRFESAAKVDMADLPPEA